MKRIAISTAALALAAGVALVGHGELKAQDQTFVSIGTGGVTGVYYPTGGAICRMVNANRKEHGIRCSVESTGGSIYNINTIRAGELEFGVAQSDWQYHAYNGTSKFEEQGAFENLRAVFSVHAEPVTIVARADAGIAHLDDLPGKRVNIGNPGSGSLGTWEVIEAAKGWSRDDLALAAQMKSSEVAQALCDNTIDAYFWLVGHPSALTQETVSTCDAVVVEVSGDVIDQPVSENSYFRYATIPGGMYAGNDNDVATFGVGATFVTSADVPEEVVYTLAKSVMENIDDFRGLHPAFANLDPADMVSASLSAPLHPGAERAYRELGLIE